MIRTLCTLALLGVLAPAALAGPLDEAKTKAHLKAAAAGDLDTLMRDYADDAVVDWVGGPLDGRYRGKDEIRAMWQKFIDANGGKPRALKLGEVEEYANAKGASVEGSARYGGAKPLKVWHLLVFHEGTLTTEIWQNLPAKP